MPHALQPRGEFEFDALREGGEILELAEAEDTFDFGLQDKKADSRERRLSQRCLGGNGNSFIDAKKIRNAVE